MTSRRTTHFCSCLHIYPRSFASTFWIGGRWLTAALQQSAPAVLCCPLAALIFAQAAVVANNPSVDAAATSFAPLLPPPILILTLLLPPQLPLLPLLPLLLPLLLPYYPFCPCCCCCHPSAVPPALLRELLSSILLLVLLLPISPASQDPKCRYIKWNSVVLMGTLDSSARFHSAADNRIIVVVGFDATRRLFLSGRREIEGNTEMIASLIAVYTIVGRRCRSRTFLSIYIRLSIRFTCSFSNVCRCCDGLID